MNDLNSNRQRLDNIHAIEPILSALRTSSLARWQSALKKLSALKAYQERLDTILATLMHYSFDGITQASENEFGHQYEASVIVWVVGSERRLCGDFNSKLLTWLDDNLTGTDLVVVQIELVVAGKPLFHLLQNHSSMPDTVQLSLLDMSLPDHHVLDQARSWFRRFVVGDIRGVYGVYNQYSGISRNKIICETLLPSLSKHDISSMNYQPEPIIETNLQQLFMRVVEQYFTIQFIMMLTESTATENATRYQIMESAMDNVERLEEELEIAVNEALRRSITREIQTLMSSAGLYR